jgi:hypothetical protein
VPGFDSILWADLDAGIAFPALLRFLIVRLHGMSGFGTIFVQLHQVVWADVHAGRTVLAFTPITLFSTYKSRHCFLTPRVFSLQLQQKAHFTKPLINPVSAFFNIHLTQRES